MKWWNVIRPGRPEVDPETGWTYQKPRVTNVVATCWIGTPLCTYHQLAKYGYMQRNRKKFVTCLVRLDDPRSVLLLFRSGKLVATGARSPSASKCSTELISYYIWKVTGHPTRVSRYQIQNITGAAKCWRLDLTAMYEELKKEDPTRVRFQVMSFPGMRYRTKSEEGKNIKITFFASGNKTFSGAKTVEDIEWAHEESMVISRRFPAAGNVEEVETALSDASDTDVDYDDD